jgi:hypothetical protein
MPSCVRPYALAPCDVYGNCDNWRWRSTCTLCRCGEFLGHVEVASGLASRRRRIAANADAAVDADPQRLRICGGRQLGGTPAVTQGVFMGDGNPVDRVRLHVKLGADEFEAEGPDEIVTGHFRVWQQLRAGAALPVGGANGARARSELFAVNAERHVVTLQQVDGSLPHAEAALLLLYGFHRRLGSDGHAVLVTRLKAALAASGYPVARVDRMLAPHVDAGLVRKRGRRIGSTYELTDAGFQRADAWMEKLGASRSLISGDGSGD